MSVCRDTPQNEAPYCQEATEHNFTNSQPKITCLMTRTDCWLGLILIKILLENRRHLSSARMHWTCIMIKFLELLYLGMPYRQPSKHCLYIKNFCVSTLNNFFTAAVILR
jgi:hypothetical protein